MFVDQIKIYTRAGKGGKGCASFLRTRSNPRGGPDGGDGGRGGDVIIRAQKGRYTLLDLCYRTQYLAPKGGNGSSNNRRGKDGAPCIIKVPVGTVVREAETGYVLADLIRDGQEVVIVQGGKGGRGNSYFKSATNRAPRHAEPGQPGEEKWLQLELKLLADVGLLGMPNAGKSTLLNSISAAQPVIADYPFTTLTPNLGVVKLPGFASFVVADIPGLIPGAHRGKGLGYQFLRHIERTKLLLHIVDLSVSGSRNPWDDFQALNRELEIFKPALANKPQLIAINKIDLPEARKRLSDCQKWFKQQRLSFFPISAKTGEGVPELVRALWDTLQEISCLTPD
jgi:GTP-binding protein